ncbi:helix-turn-helix transcriptional regulator [Levilactobacillus cerevisiae]|uniref:helix-turn-helix transcriptional regulator n=1 Tax=Levilactobacillus cerevisiae TaxID=1704076 RepID=UPI000F7808E7|nr:hypothetical protein [Levilactobacillus cerevisiae]
MTNKQTNYEPSRPIAPGESIQEALATLEMTPQNLIAETGQDSDYVINVLAGTAAITSEFAESLASVMQVPAKFWLAYEDQYQRLQKTRH